MARVRMVHAADETKLICLASKTRQMLADVDAGNIRGNGAEFAAKFGRRLRFHVEGIKLAWATEQKNHHAPLCSAEAGWCAGTGRAIQQRRQTQAHAGQAAHLQKLSACVTGMGSIREYEHEPALLKNCASLLMIIVSRMCQRQERLILRVSALLAEARCIPSRWILVALFGESLPHLTLTQYTGWEYTWPPPA